MSRILFNKEWVTEEIARAVPTTWGPCDISIGNADSDGMLMGGVIYKDFTRESIRMSVASWDRRWLSHEMLWVVFDYPFNQLGVKRIFTMTPLNRPNVVHFNDKFGFKTIVENVPGVYPGNVGVIIKCMERDDCRFLKLKSRQYKRNSSLLVTQ